MRRLLPWRKLTDVKALTVEDWRAIDAAQQAFIYQVRYIVQQAEARPQPDAGVQQED